VQISLRNNSEDAWEELCLRDYNAAAIVNARAGQPDESGEDETPPHSFYTATDMSTGTVLEAEFDGDPTIAYLPLEEALEPGEQMDLLVEFHSDILRDDIFLSGSSAGGHTYFELGQFYPSLAIYEYGWAPPPTAYGIESFYAEVADYNVSLTLPDSYTVVSTGREEKQFSDGKNTVWHLSGQSYRDFSITAGDNLAYLSKMAGDTEIRSYFFVEETGSLNSRLEAAAMLESGAAAFSQYQGLIGDYPYDSLDIVPAFGEYGGLEYPGLVRISRNLQDYLEEGVSQAMLDERLAGVIGTTVHEIAHQWFYAVVGNDQYYEAWLDEAFATFCENYLYRKLTMADDEIMELIQADRISLERWAHTLDPYLNLPAAEQSAYSYNVYTRGYLLLVDIMAEMGEEAFLAVLRDYYQAYAMGEANTGDFLAVLEEHAGDNESVWELVDGAIER
jgi:hypothetical protein